MLHEQSLWKQQNHLFGPLYTPLIHTYMCTVTSHFTRKILEHTSGSHWRELKVKSTITVALKDKLGDQTCDLLIIDQFQSISSYQRQKCCADSLKRKITEISVTFPTLLRSSQQEFASTGSLLWIITTLSQHVKLGGKVSRVKVPQMLCPHKLQPAGLEEVHPGFMCVSHKRSFIKDYVRHLRCSCLITLESITYSVSPEKSRLYPAGHGWRRTNRDPHFQMCVHSSIVTALCVCALLVAVYLIVKNVLEITDRSAQLYLLCSYYSTCLCLSEGANVSPAVQSKRRLYGLSWQDTAANTQNQIYAVFE